MANVPVLQIPRNLLFRYKFKCLEVKKAPASDAELNENHELSLLGVFEGQQTFASLRVGWTEAGFVIAALVRGKRQSVWCRANQPLESDGLRFWIDTRDTRGVHRATRYCHWFVALPQSTAGPSSPSCGMLKINRAKEDSPTINRGKTSVAAKIVEGGYDLLVNVPASLLNGWNPSEQKTIGFCAAIVDRELGWNTLTVGPDLPIAEDPSLWSSLELVQAGTNTK